MSLTSSKVLQCISLLSLFSQKGHHKTFNKTILIFFLEGFNGFLHNNKEIDPLQGHTDPTQPWSLLEHPSSYSLCPSTPAFFLPLERMTLGEASHIFYLLFVWNIYTSALSFSHHKCYLLMQIFPDYPV